MKVANFIGVIVGIIGIVLTYMNFHLEYAEAPHTSFGVYKHDNVGNVFRLHCMLFLILTIICAYNLYKIRSLRVK